MTPLMHARQLRDAFRDEVLEPVDVGADATLPGVDHHALQSATPEGDTSGLSRIGARMVKLALAEPEFFRKYGSKVSS